MFHVVTGENLFILVPYFKIYLFSFNLLEDPRIDYFCSEGVCSI